jgi:hypothetical protein
MRGFHVGLRKEAADFLEEHKNGAYPLREVYVRECREKAREFADDEAVALWARVRYLRRPQRPPTTIAIPEESTT